VNGNATTEERPPEKKQTAHDGKIQGYLYLSYADSYQDRIHLTFIFAEHYLSG